MKLSKSFLLRTVLASHFRGSTWLTSIDENGDLQIDVPQAWRKDWSYTSGKRKPISWVPSLQIFHSDRTKAIIILDNCSPADIANQIESSPVSGDWKCNLLSDGTSCGWGDITYIPTYGDNALNYCYGSGRIVISPAPTGPYELSWTSAAWVSFTGDYGGIRGGGNWLIQGIYYEVANSVKFSKYYMTRILFYSVKKIWKNVLF